MTDNFSLRRFVPTATVGADLQENSRSQCSTMNRDLRPYESLPSGSARLEHEPGGRRSRSPKLTARLD